MRPSKPTFQNQRPSNTSIPICVPVKEIRNRKPKSTVFPFPFYLSLSDFLRTPSVYKVPLTLKTFTVKTRKQSKLSSILSSTSLPSNVRTYLTATVGDLQWLLLQFQL